MSVCECNSKNKDKIDEIKSLMLKDEEFFDLADFFKVFGDSTRIKIIFVLLKSEMCVCDIASTLDMSQSAISHQLRVLRNNRLVKYRKDGKTVYYSLDDAHVEKIFDQGYEHLNHE